MIKGAPSPLKASKKAAEHMVHSARRVPLSHLLDRLESGLESVTLGRSHSSPDDSTISRNQNHRVPGVDRHDAAAHLRYVVSGVAYPI